MRDVVITGIGLVSSLGEGLEPHLAVLQGGAPHVDRETFAPYPVHPLKTTDFDRQIPKKSDQRQMEAWQRIGVYAAGLALDDAGLKDDVALKSQMHLIVAAGGGERDYAVDGQILTGLKQAENPGAYLNEHLMNDVRPTLFLAQLSNLLAGNIAIVHGVTGASRTFMGEEQCGVDALRIAHARIASGQNDLILVGGSYNAERPDILLIYELGGYLYKQPFTSVLDRADQGGGFIPGSAGAFVVLESKTHAQKRGAKTHAVLAAVAADQGNRQTNTVDALLKPLWQEAGITKDAHILSGATGVAPLTQQEHQALQGLSSKPIMNIQDVIGHTLEAQATAGVACAAGLIASGRADEVAFTSIGHRRGEGVIRVIRGRAHEG
jgi:3-oxoacyl-[acyl-carrier-protein] synthase II